MLDFLNGDSNSPSLGHLSQRLIGKLIVYTGICPSGVRHHFQTAPMLILFILHKSCSIYAIIAFLFESHKNFWFAMVT